ncbi:MAG: beta-propeller domain-containing protein [Gorillibacterium sp.]|nr:beta-propeller domain-containing protein [Gorillibacterium sp.]
MRKALVISLLAASLLLSAWADNYISPAAYADKADKTLTYEGKTIPLTFAPLLVDGVLLAPLPELAAMVGAEVTQVAFSRQITVSNSLTRLTFTPGSAFVTRNDERLNAGTASLYKAGVFAVPLALFCESFGLEYSIGADQISLSKAPTPLPVVGSYANLKNLVKNSQGNQPEYALKFSRELETVTTMNSSSTSTSKEASASAVDTGGSSDYSATNVQVAGVDEADIVKTDGNYIYQVNQQRIAIISTTPGTDMKLASMISFEQRISPQELYVDGDSLVVIAESYQEQAFNSSVQDPAIQSKRRILPLNTSATLAIVYDISDKNKILKVREVEIQGNYLTSRKVGSALYLIANQYLNTYQILENNKAEEPAPLIRDTAVSPNYTSVDYRKIYYFPNSPKSSYLNIAGIDLSKPQAKANIQTYLGAGENVYASLENLYVAIGAYSTKVTDQTTNDSLLPVNDETSTVLYKFSLDNGTMKYTTQGKVPGTILNQYSMDEHDGFFRIATTKGDMWRDDANTSKNNVYVLDSALKLTGKLEDLAPGEKIYSVRFMGKRAYMVTFKQVDPLFVIDLTLPEEPKVLGKLKIPGYSDYLHPYDETHIIGSGKEATELSVDNGDKATTMAYYQGMKLAMFDVSDVNNPKEMFKEVIGDRGTDSPLLSDHKALLFNKEKNLLAFPVNRLDLPKADQNGSNAAVSAEASAAIPQYGTFAFQGAYVYKVDLEHGFQLKGTITHLSSEDVLKAGQFGYDYTKTIDRLLYIGNTLYTLSQSEIRASNLQTLQQTGSLMIEKKLNNNK